jgi:hypothetical protein
MPAAFDLIVTDLDGTLWGPSTSVHPKTRVTWTGIATRSIPVLIATGRRITSTKEPLLANGWTVPAVMLNGAIGIDFATGARFHRQAFSDDVAQAVLAAFRAADLDPCVYVDHEGVEVFVSNHPSTHPEHLRSLGDTKRVSDLDEVVAGSNVLAFGIIGLAMKVVSPVAVEVREIAQPTLDKSYDYAGTAFTVTARGVSKWSGVESYCALHHLDPSRVLALGDGLNDLDLLRHAAVAVSFEGAAPAAMALADYLLAPAIEGGWGGLIDLLDLPLRARS